MPAFQLISIVTFLCVATTTIAQDNAAKLTNAQQQFLAGDLDGALQHLDAILEKPDLDQPLKDRSSRLTARVLQARGERSFREARNQQSLADFDRQLELQPDDAAG